MPTSRGREQCKRDSGLDSCALFCSFIQFGSEQVSGSTELLQADAVLSEANTPASTTVDYSVTMPSSADPAQASRFSSMTLITIWLYAPPVLIYLLLLLCSLISLIGLRFCFSGDY